MLICESLQGAKTESIAKTVKAILNKSLTKKTTMADIANKLLISQSQLERVFKKEYNITPNQYFLKNFNVTKKLLLGNIRSVTLLLQSIQKQNRRHTERIPLYTRKINLYN